MFPLLLFIALSACTSLVENKINHEFIEQLQQRETKSQHKYAQNLLLIQAVEMKAQEFWTAQKERECHHPPQKECIRLVREFVRDLDNEILNNGVQAKSFRALKVVQEMKQWLQKHDSAYRSVKYIQETYSLVQIKADVFVRGCQIGDTLCDEDEFPPHTVILTQDFYIGKTEVTQAFYASVMRQNPSHFKACGPNCPVDSVSFLDAAHFLNTLSLQEGLSKCYHIKGNYVIFLGISCSGYRLPTEAEWEYAARGRTNFFYSGSNDVDEVAWHVKNSDAKTHPVAQKSPNQFGLYDMSGNVMEWCNDWYQAYPEELQTDPCVNTRTKSKVARGGNWFEAPYKSRTSDRYYEKPTFRYDLQGFRIVQSIIP